jgi:Pyrimidine dimer DNA glycosylase
VITFVPYADFVRSAQALDYQRLGKQRVEAWQLWQALDGQSGLSANHPAARMWAGAETALLLYGLAVCEEWVRRGYKDTMGDRFRRALLGRELTLPVWWGDERLHANHRANLIRKDPGYYGQHGWGESPVQGYHWPC